MKPGADLRRRGLALSLASAAWLPACEAEPGEPLRIGAQSFPGYELLFLARSLGQLPADRVRLVEMPSASASLRALGAGAMDGACLTLDEVLSAQERGLSLTVVAVLDGSVGADVLLGRAGLNQLADLKGRTVGVEPSAVGAVLLQAALQSAGLSMSDVRVVSVPFDQHAAAFAKGQLDAIVSYEPVKSRLTRAGAHMLFSSAAIPGRILDVLALRETVAARRPMSVQALVNGHFAGRDAYQTEPAQHSTALARRLHLQPDEVAQAYAGLELPDRARNRRWFNADAAELRQSAKALRQLMQDSGLLTGQASVPLAFDGRFL